MHGPRASWRECIRGRRGRDEKLRPHRMALPPQLWADSVRVQALIWTATVGAGLVREAARRAPAR